MGRKRMCKEYIGELLVDATGDDVENFIEVIRQVQNEMGDKYKNYIIVPNPESASSMQHPRAAIFAFYGNRYCTDEEVVQMKLEESKKAEEKKL